MRMFKCIMCNEDEITSSVMLCSYCASRLGSEADFRESYQKTYDKFRDKYLNYREENLEKCTHEHHNAFKYAERIGAYFGVKVLKEKICTPFFVDIVMRMHLDKATGKYIQFGIEIDGGYHDSQLEYDEMRDNFIEKYHRTTIFRFRNEDVGTEFFRRAIWSLLFQLLDKKILYLIDKSKNQPFSLPVDYRMVVL